MSFRSSVRATDTRGLAVDGRRPIGQVVGNSRGDVKDRTAPDPGRTAATCCISNSRRCTQRAGGAGHVSVQADRHEDLRAVPTDRDVRVHLHFQGRACDLTPRRHRATVGGAGQRRGHAEDRRPARSSQHPVQAPRTRPRAVFVEQKFHVPVPLRLSQAAGAVTRTGKRSDAASSLKGCVFSPPPRSSARSGRRFRARPGGGWGWGRGRSDLGVSVASLRASVVARAGLSTRAGACKRGQCLAKGFCVCDRTEVCESGCFLKTICL